MSKASPRKSRSTETPSRRKSPEAQPGAPAVGSTAEPAARREASHERERPHQREASHEEIARRAYALFQERGGQHGDDLADWLRAEAELTARSGNGGNGGRRQP
ncbi:MAG: DUF2934 domain-containing protein [Candidatus Methylomirabilales bacterium]